MGGEGGGGRETVWWRATCWASLTTAPTTCESVLLCVCGDEVWGRGDVG